MFHVSGVAAGSKKSTVVSTPLLLLFRTAIVEGMLSIQTSRRPIPGRGGKREVKIVRSVLVTIVVALPYFERREPVLTVDTGGAVPPRNNFIPLTGRDDMVAMQYTVWV